MRKSANQPTKAVIYCRVSSEKQKREGDGLNSQETRCREFAKTKGYQVVKVFKDEAISGALLKDDRPACNACWHFLILKKKAMSSSLTTLTV